MVSAARQTLPFTALAGAVNRAAAVPAPVVTAVACTNSYAGTTTTQ